MAVFIRTTNHHHLLLLLLLFATISGPAFAIHGLPWIPTTPDCQGTIRECNGRQEDYEFSDKYSRRILSAANTSNYIGYDALRRDSVPCSLRGASYYNCRAGTQTNPYSRGCSAITRCRSSTD